MNFHIKAAESVHTRNIVFLTFNFLNQIFKRYIQKTLYSPKIYFLNIH